MRTIFRSATSASISGSSPAGSDIHSPSLELEHRLLPDFDQITGKPPDIRSIFAQVTSLQGRRLNSRFSAPSSSEGSSCTTRPSNAYPSKVQELALTLTREAKSTITSTRTRGGRRRGNDKFQDHAFSACPVSGRTRYRDRRQAGDALMSYRLQGGKKVTAQRMGSQKLHGYRCPERACNGGFHLMSVHEWAEMTESKTVRPRVPAASVSGRLQSCHVIDIENQMGGGYWAASDVERWWQVYRQQAVGIAEGDLIIIGVAEQAAKKARTALRGERIKWRIGADGPNGADLALLAAIDVDRISRRYSRLILASGDHIFAPLAQEARSLGMTVQIVSGRGLVSRELQKISSIRTNIRSTSLEAQRRTLAAIRTVHAAAIAA
ncbi:hypothetical protein ARZXY2_4909 (plasmid) [Arthrobacter sp. ZXY-2]|nr:hypothetical protein ARZXY2_4909 [Arthrobacter sp. ZXY-2]